MRPCRRNVIARDVRHGDEFMLVRHADEKKTHQACLGALLQVLLFHVLHKADKVTSLCTPRRHIG